MKFSKNNENNQVVNISRNIDFSTKDQIINPIDILGNNVLNEKVENIQAVDNTRNFKFNSNDENK